jgi:hypothetical protein
MLGFKLGHDEAQRDYHCGLIMAVGIDEYPRRRQLPQFAQRDFHHSAR